MSHQTAPDTLPPFSALLATCRASPEPETELQDIIRTWEPHTTTRSRSPQNSPLRKRASSQSRVGKYRSMSVPLPLRLSRLRNIHHKPRLNPRLIEEHEQAQGFSASSSSFSSRDHDLQSNSLGISIGSASASSASSITYDPNVDHQETRRDRESEQSGQGDSLYSGPSSSSSLDNAPNDADEFFIPSSPRPKARTLPIQPPSSPPSSASSSSSDEDAPRGRRPFPRSRSYAQRSDSFNQPHDPFRKDYDPLASEYESRYKPGDSESRYGTPPPPDLRAGEGFEDKWSIGMLGDVSSREGRTREGSWGWDESQREYSTQRRFGSQEPRTASGSGSRDGSTTQGSILESRYPYEAPESPRLPTLSDVFEDDEDSEDELIDDGDDNPGAIRLRHPREFRGPSTSQGWNAASQPSTSHNNRSHSAPLRYYNPKALFPESEWKLQKTVYTQSSTVRGMRVPGYVPSPLGPDGKKSHGKRRMS